MRWRIHDVLTRAIVGSSHLISGIFKLGKVVNGVLEGKVLASLLLPIATKTGPDNGVKLAVGGQPVSCSCHDFWENPGTYRSIPCKVVHVRGIRAFSLPEVPASLIQRCEFAYGPVRRLIFRT